MDGHSEVVDAFNNVLWADAELLGVSIDYESFTLSLREANGRDARLKCEGFLGYEAIGFWDEVVIADANLTEDGAFASRCRQRIDERLGIDRPPSGSEARNRGALFELLVVLSDQCELRVAMRGLRLETFGGSRSLEHVG